MILIDHIYSVFNAGGTAGFESYKNSGSSQTKLLFCRDELFILLKWAFCLDDPGSKKVSHTAQPTTYLVRGSTWDTEKGRILWTMYQAKHKKKH